MDLKKPTTDPPATASPSGPDWRSVSADFHAEPTLGRGDTSQCPVTDRIHERSGNTATSTTAAARAAPPRSAPRRPLRNATAASGQPAANATARRPSGRVRYAAAAAAPNVAALARVGSSSWRQVSPIDAMKKNRKVPSVITSDCTSMIDGLNA